MTQRTSSIPQSESLILEFNQYSENMVSASITYFNICHPTYDQFEIPETIHFSLGTQT